MISGGEGEGTGPKPFRPSRLCDIVRGHRVLPGLPMSTAPARLLLASLLLAPLPQALAEALCPTDAWQCQREGDRWVCSGMPDAGDIQAAAAERLDAETRLRGDLLEGEDGKHLELRGNASARRADQQLRAERIRYEVETETVRAEGGIRYEDAQNAFYAQRIEAEMAAKRSRMEDLRYALKARRGQGAAASATHAEGRTALESVSYTTCPGEDPSWRIEAERLDIDHEAATAVARKFKLRLGGVPVFYAPYASFPIDDTRKSGVLAPRIGGGSDGLDLALPYYFNLAPNYDATLIPRWIGNRGAQLGGEFRYLYRDGHGQVDGEWLPDDDRFGRSRERLRVRHHARLTPALRIDADLNHVSDDRYFVDLGDSLNASSTSVLGSQLLLSGGNRNWHYSALADRHELILPDVPEEQQQNPYRRMPQLLLGYEQRRGSIEYGARAEWVAFRRDDFCLPQADGSCASFRPVEGDRLDLNPYLAYVYEPLWGFLRARTAFRHTRYDLDWRNASPSLGPRPRSIERSTPIVSLDGGLLFERSGAFGRPSWRQTLEPRLFYLYVPDRNQDDIPVFDSAELDFSFAQLFRDNRFAGADRQGDANQLTLALTTRLFDDSDGRELGALSIGQIRYFDPPEVFLPGPAALPPARRQRSAYVAEWRGDLGTQWNFSGGLRYDPETERTDFAGARLQRHFGRDGLLNLGYRYRPDRLEQTDIGALLPLGEHWRAVLRWNYSLRESTTLDAVAGFEYRSCCYSVRFLSRRYLRGIGDEHRTAVFLELELAGLGSLGRDPGEFLRRAILGYKPFGGSTNE